MKIVDTHLHIWDVDRLQYPWLKNVPFLNRTFDLSDYAEATQGVGIEKMVFVQCEADFSQFQDEADWVTEQASVDPRIEGIVPWAPLELGDGARPALERLAANKLIKGIRRIIEFEADVEFCRQPGFVQGVRLLADYDLHFEINIKGAAQFERVLSLVGDCPKVRFILDHIAKPDIAQGMLDPWRGQMAELARFPNTWCKMSGLATEADFVSWKPADFQPYIEWTLERFGWDRTMFGGDWPVAAQATTFPRWVNTLSEVVAGASESERQQLFYDNAVAFYRLA